MLHCGSAGFDSTVEMTHRESPSATRTPANAAQGRILPFLAGNTLVQEQTPYSLIGGENGVARLCDRFYELMDSVPQFAAIRAMHPADLQASRDKLFMFLSGWLGGPDLYVQQIGHPMLRRRHLPFAIGTAERDQWVACMYLAMESIGIDEAVREKLLTAFFDTADFMRNQPA